MFALAEFLEPGDGRPTIVWEATHSRRLFSPLLHKQFVYHKSHDMAIISGYLRYSLWIILLTG